MTKSNERIQTKILKLLEDGPYRKAEIIKKLSREISSEKSLQRLLRSMETEGLIVPEGNTRNKIYKLALSRPILPSVLNQVPIRHSDIPNQENFKAYKAYLKMYFEPSATTRGFAGFDINRLKDYTPNEDYLLSPETRRELERLPSWAKDETLGATYNIEIISTFLKHFTYNSARLEDSKLNFASTIDIINDPDAFKNTEEKILVVNHRRAVDLMVKYINYPEYEIEEAIGQGAQPIKELHMTLMNGLLKDDSEGEIRSKPVEISGSSYLPTNDREKLELLLNMIAIKSSRIRNPHERAFFSLLHISYLQAFNDGNKRTARLFSNLPLISNKLIPHSFHKMDEEDYHESIVYYYETADSRPLEKLWLETYLQGIPLFLDSNKSLETANLMKIELNPLRNRAVKEIVKEKIDRSNYVRIVERVFKEDAELSKKYDLETFQALVVTACDKLSKNRIGSAIYDISEREINDWAKIWQKAGN